MDAKTWDRLLAYKESMDSQGGISHPADISAPTKSISQFEEYLKVIRLPFAPELKRPVIFAHLAQTLDGKIACCNGYSKWIGNKDNLVHAHRMRALCDAVMVGKQTWEIDNPQLNVRHVRGKDPVRIIIEGHSTQNNNYRKVYLVENGATTENSWEKPGDLMAALLRIGIRSIFLEGGGKTISYFLQNRLIDYLHLHISPILMGSGKDSIILPTVDSPDLAVSFEEYQYIPFGSHLLFTGKVSTR